MVIAKIKPLKVRGKKGYLYRFKETVFFILRERLIGSRLFLLIYILYTFTVVIGTVFLVFFSDLLLGVSDFLGVDPVSIYYSLIVLGFSLTAMNDLAFWIIVFSAASLLSEEIKSGLIVSYYSRPVSGYFYLTSRVLSILFVLFFIALIPLSVMVTVPVLRHPESFPGFDAFRILGIMFLSLLSMLLVFLFYIFLVSTIVVVVEERGASVLISFVIYYTSYIAGLILSMYLGKEFYLVSLNFWVVSTILVSLGIPWMDLNEGILRRFGGGLMQIDLGLEPIIYVMGSFFLVTSTIVLCLVSFYLYSKRALEGEEV